MLGLLLLALAAFLWVNFLVRGSVPGFGFLSAAPAPPADEAEAPLSQAQAPGVAPVPESQVARDLEIIELPFMVTEPPTGEESAAEQAGEAGGEALAGEARRRATVNPFSPVIQAGAGAPAPAAGQAAGVPRSSAVTEVPVPARPGGQVAAAPAPQAPKAPAPAAVAPGSRATGTLPRALPGGTLGGTPQLLRSAIGATDVPAGNAGRVAAVREPEETQPRLEEAGDGAPSRAEPQPLREPLAERAAERTPVRAPLQAGTSALSRYLRDNNVRFTGSVIGPVSVGVFRSALTSAPVVISLGQSLPDTSIVLTDLRGQQAELTLGDSTQTLTLELRR